jgi:hypothetical protein
VANTYDVTTDAGKVRLLLNDVADPWVFNDAEIDAFLALEGDVVKLAAAQAIDVNATNEALASKVIRTQDLTTDGAKLADAMRKHAGKHCASRPPTRRRLLRARRRQRVLLLVGPGAHRTPDLLALMRPQRTPAPAPPVVPARLGRNHAPVAAGTRNATGTLRRHAADRRQAGWDPDTRTTTPDAGTAYAEHITARIQSLVTHRSDAQVVVAEDVVITASYLVTVDRDLEVIEGDAFTVETCPRLHLVDRILRVEHVVLGTERFERDLFCNLLEPPPAED